MVQQSGITRTSGSMLLAILATTSLFYLMHSLIQVTGIVTETSKGFVIDFVKPFKMTQVKPKPQKATKPPEPDLPPVAPSPGLVTGDGPAIWEPLPGPAPNGEFGPLGGLTDGAMMPLVRVQPVYPRRALAQGIQGYVVVEFNVAPDGSVRNPRVIEHSPSGIFDKAALNAVMRFRYRPQVTDGRATMVTGVQNRFTFELSSG